METKHTPLQWEAFKVSDGWVIKEKGLYEKGFSDRIAELFDYPEKMEANAKLIAAAPELLQMVYDLKNCIKRLTSDDALTQYDKDTEAQWIGEAHELINRINQ